MPKIVNSYLIFDFFLGCSDFRISRVRAYFDEMEKRGALESENKSKLVNFSLYYIQRRLTFDYIMKKYIVRDMVFKKNAALTQRVVSLALAMCYFQNNCENVLSELKILIRQYQNGAMASTLVIILNNFLEKTGFTLPEVKFKDDASLYSFRYSCPRELCAHLIGDIGAENVREMLEGSLVPPIVHFRLNTTILHNQKLRDEFVAGFSEKYFTVLKKPFPGYPFYSCDRNSFNFTLTSLSEFRSGLITPMGMSAYLAAYIIGAKGDELVFDACASPGNKTTHLAEVTSMSSRIIACDLSDSKVAKITENVDRLKLRNVFTYTGSSQFVKASDIRNKFNSIGDSDELFDKIMLDAPCSGLGLLRNRVELKYRFDVSDLVKMPDTQFPILQNVSRLLKRGGSLLYSTCTMNKKENSGLIARFLSENKDFKVVSLERDFAGFGHDFNLLDADYRFAQIIPDSSGAEGFFYALLRRE